MRELSAKMKAMQKARSVRYIVDFKVAYFDVDIVNESNRAPNSRIL